MIAEKTLEIAIIGGGPSSAEIAGNIIQLAGNSGGHMPKVRIFAGSLFMKRFPNKVKKLVHSSLARRAVEIIEDGHAKLIDNNRIGLENEKEYYADLIFRATGVNPSKIFTESGLPVGPDCGLLVNRFLHPLNIRKYSAAAIAFALEGNELEEFDLKGKYLLIFNLGNGAEVLHKYRLTFGGRLAFIIKDYKDYIDREFMRRFQALE